MQDSFVIRILLILVAAGILIALVIQYKRSKSDDSNKESFYVDNTVAKQKDQRLNYEHQFQQRRAESQSKGVAPYDGTMTRAKSMSQQSAGAPYNQNTPRNVFEEYRQGQGQGQGQDVNKPPQTDNNGKNKASFNNVMPSEPLTNNAFKPVDFGSLSKTKQTECYPRDRLTAEDLLPKDAANSKWAQVNPAGQGDVQGQNFLTAGFHIGINTVGQSLRNPNLQLRSEPPIPKVDIGPWNQSTMEFDTSRRHLELGEA